jgi:hypothetical protein
MVTQLLFGELCEIRDYKNKSWVKIRCVHDDYLGWIDPKQILYLEDGVFEQYNSYHPTSFEVSMPLMNHEVSYPILLGSTLPFFDGLSLKIPGMNYTFSGQAIDIEAMDLTPELLIKVAKKFINSPYLWGGRSPFGIDCSGFTQVVYKILGLKLPRDASQQVSEGELVAFATATKPGDLAFFENKEGKIIHVGIMLEDNKIIHASGKVRVDILDQVGILNVETKKYTHFLRVIKRIITQDDVS